MEDEHCSNRFGRNSVAFQRMDGAMLASIEMAKHKARAAATFRRPRKIFEDGIQLMDLNDLLAFDDVIASRGGIPLIERGAIIGAIGCSEARVLRTKSSARRARH